MPFQIEETDTNDVQADFNKQEGKPQSRSRKQRLGQEKIYYPILEECGSLTENQTWKYVLHNAARGKFARGFGMRGDMLVVRGKKPFTVEVPRDPKEALPVVLRFLATHGNYLVNDGQNYNTEDSLNKTKKTKSVKTNAATLANNLSLRQHFRESKINDYINGFQQSYLLTERERRDLEVTINYGFSVQFFEPKDIELNKKTDRVSTIHGLRFHAKNRRFRISKDNVDRALSKKKLKSQVKKTKILTVRSILKNLLSQIEVRKVNTPNATSADNCFNMKALYASSEM